MFGLNEMTEIRREEKDIHCYDPYRYCFGTSEFYYWIMTDQPKNKIVIVVPEQPIDAQNMEHLCLLLHKSDYQIKVVYTNESSYSLGHGVGIKKLK